RSVIAVGGDVVPLDIDTICLHGDGPHAVSFAILLRRRLEHAGVAIRAD
ncbi:LamB/YcsF family protein, partial [Pseudomonas sp. MWU12-2534b]